MLRKRVTPHKMKSKLSSKRDSFVGTSKKLSFEKTKKIESEYKDDVVLWNKPNPGSEECQKIKNNYKEKCETTLILKDIKEHFPVN